MAETNDEYNSPLSKRSKLDEETKDLFSPNINLGELQKTALWSRLQAYKSLCDYFSIEYERMLTSSHSNAPLEGTLVFYNYRSKEIFG